MGNSGTSGSASYTIRGHSLVFRGDTNEYQADGVKVPSVEELLRRHSELRGLDDGAAVSADEKKRAENAAALREEIGRYEKEGAEGSSGEFRNYLSLKKSRGIKAESAMLPVLIFDEAGKPACAGMVDLSGTVNGVPALIGISLAERMSQGRAALQLNLCRLGLMQSYGKACDKLFVMRLLHGSAELSEVPVLEEAAYALLRECLPSFRAESPVKPQDSGAGRIRLLQGRLPMALAAGRRRPSRLQRRRRRRLRSLRRGRAAQRTLRLRSRQRPLSPLNVRLSVRGRRSASGTSAGSGGFSRSSSSTS